MKLPEAFDLYKHNSMVTDLASIAASLTYPHDGRPLDGVIKLNMASLRRIQAMVTHLELALEEIGKLRDER